MQSRALPSHAVARVLIPSLARTHSPVRALALPRTRALLRLHSLSLSNSSYAVSRARAPFLLKKIPAEMVKFQSFGAFRTV